MKLNRVSLIALFGSTLLLTQAGFAAPPAGGGPLTPKQPAQQVRFDIQITRTLSGGKEAQPGDGTPVIMGAPVLTTLDRNTASVAVNGTGTSYNVALSPTIETSDNSVQVLWNWRIGGKELPGASSFTLTGATRVQNGKDTNLAELTLTDPQTGRAATFRMRVQTTIGSDKGGDKADERTPTATVPTTPTTPTTPTSPTKP